MNDDTHDEVTLRDGSGKINEMLEGELTERLSRAGIDVLEARISHLAYAPEIAGAMLQRQQASAVVAARRQIVNGAVGMVEMALAQLAERGIVFLNEERKAAMVSNLLVVLCSDKAASPIVKAGSLYP
jgi:regulator of protease activity HflC (stomatin/prohibitin superfamily)